VHRTFLEFFCEEAIVDRFEREQTLTLDALKTEIFGHWPDESWHELLRLVAGRLAPKFVKEVLDWLLQQPDPNQSCNQIFLAARCVGEVRNRGELGSVEAQVRQATEDLTEFDLTYIMMPWSVKRGEVITIFCDVWRDDPNTLAWLKERAQSDENWDVRQTAVQELASGWKNDISTLPWLKERAQSDEHWDVRQCAVQELVRGWKDDPNTLPWLKGRSQFDESRFVRQRAVREVATGWKDEPDTLPWLKERAQSDEHWDVRQCAVKELARGWKDDPETLPWLKELAQFKERRTVRKSARQELALGWKDDPEIQAFLKGL
jgi:predicted NACHT family NTPase